VEINTGDTAWVLAATALVVLMTPALGFFYGGLVRQKNVLSTIMHSFFILCLISVVWTLWGFTLAFGDGNRFIGNLDFIGLRNIDGNPLPNAPTIPGAAFVMFQGAFAIITPALITGAFAERKRFKAFVLFSLLWSTLIYSPLAHWVWAPTGWIFKLGALDFAGGTVVHISSGVAALMCAIFLGKRKGYPSTMMPPHNLTMCFVGASLLWVGWFGFNAGSALSAGALATLAFANTQIATACAALTWPIAEWILRGKPTVLGGLSGAVAGLVAITPAAGFVTPAGAISIGAIAGVLCLVTSSYMKRALKYDDALDAYGIHGIGGMWGAIATGIFLAPGVNPNIAGLNPELAKALAAGTHPVVWLQIKAVVITVLLSGIGSAVVLAALRFTIGLRVSPEHESEGLDLSQHGEEGYNEAA
jgi:Amt family ammonium transporter